MTQEHEAAGAVLGAVASVGGAMGAVVGSLFEAEGFLGKMFGAAGASTQKFEVNEGNILQAGKIISDQADVLLDKLEKAEQDLWVDVEGGEVNEKIVAAWNSRLVVGDDSYAGRVRQYCDSLKDLAVQLRDASTRYGFTEDEVKSAFGDKGVG